ncbi:putative LacI-family transcriptional regulator [Actinoplanes missouriensis 431]|uniref:Putative LacI-family transcriptional regulator n=1 Tax=Actinoplanes missouriensis (strain ATCC 14538 / DSM 43046 / CBS 188.64 / JCM 3121 / NBRC 102363 / NCIMB 12654 / NRRL B-3342 / UNCC 431) TaxID=512565 RepID=I0H9F5_ACTM4|nr:LacI family DNA-binding transcriptional regulator [Actinoplanes missouriensis]BAL89642.1 putative LacI-family transcriptional regulator [Actinoplanes missouriensis 431]
MPPGLKDVAARAGVSIKTVSNVVNGYTHVSADTRARVQEAIDALGYIPNAAARQLRTRRSGVIALAVPELQSPYFAEMAGLIVQAAERRSWTVLIDQTDGQAERERNLVAGLRRHAIDGLIFSPLALAGEELSRGGDTPMVLLGERVWHGPADHVAIDNTEAAADATRHLCGLGRRSVAAIGAQDFASAVTAHQRLAGYRAAIEEAGLAWDPLLVARVERFHRADGAAAMAALLQRPRRPDAVFCFNDLLALGAIRTLLEQGVRVPEDVAVIGFDDIEDGRFSTPTLSTVAPDTARIARLAVDLLAERLGDGPAASDAPREVRVAHRLVVRESTAG